MKSSIAAMILLGGVSFSRNLVAAYPTNVQSNVAYGPDPQEVLDVCTPSGAPGPLPGFIILHGGGWNAGDKEGPLTRILCDKIASMGYVAFNIDYRLVQNDATSFPNPDAINSFPIPLVDTQLAVRWVRQNAAVYDVDISHICSWGDSAGAQLAVFLGVEGTIYPSGDPAATLYPDVSPAVNCVIDNSGPTDFTLTVDGTENSDSYLNAEEYINSTNLDDLKAASPLFYASSRSAPTIITQGTQDARVLPVNATELQTALQDDGVPVELISYDGGHVFQGLTLSEETSIIRQTLDWAIAHYAPVPDTIPPTVSIVAPSDGASLGGYFVSVSGTASDNMGVVGVSVSVDGGPFEAASGLANWTYALNAQHLDGGPHTIQAKAWDAANNSATSSIVTIHVERPGRSRGGWNPWD